MLATTIKIKYYPWLFFWLVLISCGNSQSGQSGKPGTKKPDTTFTHHTDNTIWVYNTIEDQAAFNLLQGTWYLFGKCGDESMNFYTIEVVRPDSIVIGCNSNQLVVFARFKKAARDNTGRSWDLFYTGSDIGKGPAAWDWENFDKAVSVATITLGDGNNNLLFMDWYGFYNTQTRLPFWNGQNSEGPEWATKNDNTLTDQIMWQKCGK